MTTKFEVSGKGRRSNPEQSTGRALIEGRRAVTPVRFGDDAAFQVVEVLLHQSGGQWRVDDLRYEDGGTLRGLLRPAPRPAP
ncbi:MAG: hypothetical protein HYZ17_14675 [Betaproteobacteria bacterium]|nr:hypothetical protein [Betaproteobacteria bacterium]